MLDETRPLTFGVLADTHIPDRVKNLPDHILQAFERAHVDRILHAGDSANLKAIRILEKIAPVTVVQGNRDFLMGMTFPQQVSFTAYGVRISLCHGYRSMGHYLVDKWLTIRDGYRFERYYQHLAQDYLKADVIIFGHTHHQTVQWINGQVFFNPGAAYPCKYNHYTPQFGLLSITPEGVIRTACH
jgi:hypothetical protein